MGAQGALSLERFYHDDVFFLKSSVCSWGSLGAVMYFSYKAVFVAGSVIPAEVGACVKCRRIVSFPKFQWELLLKPVDEKDLMAAGTPLRQWLCRIGN